MISSAVYGNVRILRDNKNNSGTVDESVPLSNSATASANTTTTTTTAANTASTPTAVAGSTPTDTQRLINPVAAILSDSSSNSDSSAGGDPIQAAVAATSIGQSDKPVVVV
jgi:hypothetical protein